MAERYLGENIAWENKTKEQKDAKIAWDKTNVAIAEQKEKRKNNKKAAKAAKAAKSLEGTSGVKKATKQPKSTFKGAAQEGQDMYKIVIDHTKDDLLAQERVFVTGLQSCASNRQSHGLDMAIRNMKDLVRKDFRGDRVDPLTYGRYETDATTGDRVICVTDAAKKRDADLEDQAVVRVEVQNFTEYKTHKQALLSIAIGNIDDVLMASCKKHANYDKVINDNDLIGFLKILHTVCSKNPATGMQLVDIETANLDFLETALGRRQEKNESDTDFAKNMEDMVDALIHSLGPYCLGQEPWNIVLAKQSTPMTFKEYINANADVQEAVLEKVRERTIARVIIRGCSNTRIQKRLAELFVTGSTTCYPSTVK